MHPAAALLFYLTKQYPEREMQLLCFGQVRKEGEEELRALHPVAALLSYLTKAPLVPDGTPVVNALGRQRAMLENLVRACIGLPPDNNMMLEFK